MKSVNKAKEERALGLLDEYRNGNQNAFAYIYNMYAAALMNYGSCLTSDKELVKDCVHDVFVKLLVKSKLQKITNVGSYLFISLRNRLLDEFRRNEYSADQPINDLMLHRCAKSAETVYIESERRRHVHSNVVQLFGELSPRQQEAFKLYFIDQCKYDEICKILHMNYPCVRNLVYRGMVKLRSSVAFRQLKSVAE